MKPAANPQPPPRPAFRPGKRSAYPEEHLLAEKFARESKLPKTEPRGLIPTAEMRIARKPSAAGVKPHVKRRPSSCPKCAPHAKGPSSRLSHLRERRTVKPSEMVEVNAMITRVTAEIGGILQGLQSLGKAETKCEHLTEEHTVQKLNAFIASLRKQIAAVEARISAVSATRLLERDIENIREISRHEMELKVALAPKLKLMVEEDSQNLEYCRQMHQMAQAARSHVKVFCRIKPEYLGRSSYAFDRTASSASWTVADMTTPNTIPAVAFSGESHIFDSVLGQDADQVRVFQCLRPQLDRAINDSSGLCVLALGERASGKHYTINGPLYSISTSELVSDLSGLIPRVLAYLKAASPTAVGEISCRAFNLSRSGTEEILGDSATPWLLADDTARMCGMVNSFALASARTATQHSVFQIRVAKPLTRGETKEIPISLVVVHPQTASGEEKEFAAQSQRALAEVMRVLVDPRLRTRLRPPCKAAGLTRVLAETLAPNAYVVVVAHLESRNGPGTQGTLDLLRDMSLLI